MVECGFEWGVCATVRVGGSVCVGWSVGWCGRRSRRKTGAVVWRAWVKRQVCVCVWVVVCACVGVCV